jgi:hypothetical protein
MSVAGYAKSRGVTEEAIRQQIRAGIIGLVARGRVDIEQADRAWFGIRRSRVAVQRDDTGTRAAAAKIAAAFAKLRLTKDQLEAARERYVERKDAIERARIDSAAFLAALQQIPTERATERAELADLDPAVARHLLERFILSAISELGDVAGEVAELIRAV